MRRPACRLRVEALDERITPTAGQPDPTFGVGGHVLVPFDIGWGHYDRATAVLMQPDGKVLVGGTVTAGATGVSYDIEVVRLNADGSLDPTFGTGGSARVALDLGGTDGDAVSAMALQADGKIVLAGNADTGGDGGSDVLVARLTADGALDTTFNGTGVTLVGYDLSGPGTGPENNDSAAGVAIQADGAIVVVGWGHAANSKDALVAARLDPGGSLDPTFGTGGKLVVLNSDLALPSTSEDGSAVAIQADGKILFSGSSNHYFVDDQAQALVVRVNADGSLDPTFGTGGQATFGYLADAGFVQDYAAAIAVQADGKIVVAGSMDTGFNHYHFAVARLMADGAVDAGFGGNGTGGRVFQFDPASTWDAATGVALLPDGRVVVAGYGADPTRSAIAVARTLADGTPDPTFGIGGQMLLALPGRAGPYGDVANAVALDAAGRVVLAGRSDGGAPGNDDFAVVRLLGEDPAAHTSVWSGLAGNSLWSDPGNWYGGVPANATGPIPTIVEFPTGAYSTQDIAGLVVDQLRFEAAGGSLVLATDLSLDDGRVASQVITGSGNTFISSVGGQLVLPSGTSPDVWVGGGNLGISAPVSGGGHLDKDGDGTLYLATANTYSGGTIVRQGALDWGNPAALGTGTVQLGDAATPTGAQVFLRSFTPGVLPNDILVERAGAVVGSLPGVGATGYGGTVTLAIPGEYLFLLAGSQVGTTFSGRITGTGRPAAFSPYAPGRKVILANATGTPNDFTDGVPGGNTFVTIQDGATLELDVSSGHEQLPDNAYVQFESADSVLSLVTASGTGTETIGSLNSVGLGTGLGQVVAGAPGEVTLTLTGSTLPNRFDGTIADGAGTLTLSVVNTTASGQYLQDVAIGGPVTIAGGVVVVNGTVADGPAIADVVVASGGTLSGTGTVAGTVHVLSGGIITPGTPSTGILSVGNLDLDAGGTLAVWVNGPTPGTDHDQFHVTGTVTLGGTLAVNTDAVSPLPPGMTVVILNNDGIDPIVGTFAGLAQGAVGTVNGQHFTISYTGGDGNDITLTTASPPPPSNTPPTISDIPNQSAVPPGTTVGPLSFTVADAETPGAGLFVQWSSSNAALVPSSNVGFSVSGSNRSVTVTPAAGQTGTATITLTVTDGGGLTASVTFTVTVSAPPPAVAPSRNVVAGGTANGGAASFVPDANGQYAASPDATLSPSSGFTGQVRTTQADVNGDGMPDTILVTGPGTPIRMAVVSGADNSTVLVQPFDPFGGNFTGGGFVAAADLDGDGKAEFIVTPDQGGGPRVSIFSLVNGAAVVKANFLGIDDANFRGGCRAALGDVNKDGTPDVAVSAGFLGGPRTALFDGKTVFTTPTRLVGDFFAFPGSDATTLRNGVFVAAGDVDGDGFADLIFGGGPGGAPRVFILSGALISANDAAGAQANPIANFFVAGNSNDRGGVRLATKNSDSDAKADVITGSGEGSPANVRIYLGKNFIATGEPDTFQDISVFGGGVLPGGVFVG